MADAGGRRGEADGGSFCPEGKCEGSGFILDDEGVAHECPCRERKISRARTHKMGTGVPRRFLREASFDRNPLRDMNPAVKRDIRAFTRDIEQNLDEGRGRWFQGDVGTGKTLLAMMISKAALAADRSVLIYSVPGLLAEIKETYDDDSERSFTTLLEKLSEVDLLHLDDLGAEKRTEWVLEMLYLIIDARWRDQRSIVVTTNLELDELREQVGARTVSRLVEICGDPVPVMGRDLRIVAPEPEDEDDRLSA